MMKVVTSDKMKLIFRGLNSELRRACFGVLLHETLMLIRDLLIIIIVLKIQLLPQEVVESTY